METTLLCLCLTLPLINVRLVMVEATLPSSRGAYFCSFLSLQLSVPATSGAVLCHLPGPSLHTDPTMASLATASSHPDWHSLTSLFDNTPFSSQLMRPLIGTFSLPHSHQASLMQLIGSTWSHLSPLEFQCWLGVLIYSPAQNIGFADSLGDHQVGCNGYGDSISRHNSLRDVVFTAAQSAALQRDPQV